VLAANFCSSGSPNGSSSLSFVLSPLRSAIMARLANVAHGSNQFQTSKKVDVVGDYIYFSATKLAGFPAVRVNTLRTAKRRWRCGDLPR